MAKQKNRKSRPYSKTEPQKRELAKGVSSRTQFGLKSNTPLFFSALAIIVSLLGIFIDFKGRERVSQAEQIINRINVDKVLDEAWDDLGGEPFSSSISELKVETKDYIKARRLLDEAQLLAPQYHRVFFIKASRHWLRHETNQGIEAIEKAITLRPNNAPSLVMFGLLLLNKEESSRALEAFEKALLLDPDNANTLSHRAISLNELGRSQEALSVIKTVLQKEPQTGEYHGLEGRILSDLGRFQEAIASIDRSLELGVNIYSVYCLRAQCLSVLGRHEEALDDFAKAFTLHSPDARALNSQHFALLSLGRTKDAINALEWASRLEPKEPGPYANRAAILLVEDGTEAALQVLSEGIHNTGDQQLQTYYDAIIEFGDAAPEKIMIDFKAYLATP